MDFDDHGFDLNAEQPIADSNQLDLAYFQAMSQSSPAFHVLRPGMPHLHMILYVSVDDSCIDVWRFRTCATGLDYGLYGAIWKARERELKLDFSQLHHVRIRHLCIVSADVQVMPWTVFFMCECADLSNRNGLNSVLRDDMSHMIIREQSQESAAELWRELREAGCVHSR